MSLTMQTITLHRQHGITLIIGLVFLLLITLLGISTMSTTVLEERMARNSQTQAQNLQIADSGVSMMLNDPSIRYDTSYCSPQCADFDDDSVTGSEYGGNGNSGVGVKYRVTSLWNGAGVENVETAYGVSNVSSYIEYAATATNLKTGQKKVVRSGVAFRSQATTRSKN